MNNQLLFKMLEGQNIEHKYYLNKLLGSGGFGGVYLADEVVKDQLIRQVAIKIILSNNQEKELKELIFSTALKHPNLIDCYSCGECELNGHNFLYLLMEKADYSLEDELKKGKFSQEKVKKLVLDIVNGLDYLHSQLPKIVHRDLKPGNILKVADKWKISDFGLVRSLQNNSTKTTTMMGSIAYAPPEAFNGKISIAWDMWSLGIIIYELLTGELPFNSSSPLELMQQILSQNPDFQNIPDNWKKIIGKCLAKESNKRLTTSDLLKIFQQQNTQNNKIIISNSSVNNEQIKTYFDHLLSQVSDVQNIVKNIDDRLYKLEQNQNKINPSPVYHNNISEALTEYYPLKGLTEKLIQEVKNSKDIQFFHKPEDNKILVEKSLESLRKLTEIATHSKWLADQIIQYYNHHSYANGEKCTQEEAEKLVQELRELAIHLAMVRYTYDLEIMYKVTYLFTYQVSRFRHYKEGKYNLSKSMRDNILNVLFNLLNDQILINS
jgi:serine/threonine protein kinase